MALPSIIRVGRVDSQYWTILMVLSQLVYKLKTGRLGPVLFLILIFLIVTIMVWAQPNIFFPVIVSKFQTYCGQHFGSADFLVFYFY